MRWRTCELLYCWGRADKKRCGGTAMQYRFEILRIQGDETRGSMPLMGLVMVAGMSATVHWEKHGLLRDTAQ